MGDRRRRTRPGHEREEEDRFGVRLRKACRLWKLEASTTKRWTSERSLEWSDLLFVVSFRLAFPAHLAPQLVFLASLPLNQVILVPTTLSLPPKLHTAAAPLESPSAGPPTPRTDAPPQSSTVVARPGPESLNLPPPPSLKPPSPPSLDLARSSPPVPPRRPFRNSP